SGEYWLEYRLKSKPASNLDMTEVSQSWTNRLSPWLFRQHSFPCFRRHRAATRRHPMYGLRSTPKTNLRNSNCLMILANLSKIRGRGQKNRMVILKGLGWLFLLAGYAVASAEGSASASIDDYYAAIRKGSPN